MASAGRKGGEDNGMAIDAVYGVNMGMENTWLAQGTTLAWIGIGDGGWGTLMDFSDEENIRFSRSLCSKLFIPSSPDM